MMNPASVVPGSLMPKYSHQFTNIADFDTAYGEAVTVKTVFNVPYDKPGMPKLGGYEEAKANALKEAVAIAADMKNQDVKDKVANGQIPEIVALIAYLNSLK
jgi:cytochrome c oxidase cbb3-type subunit 2